jgi:hypothetical protein
MKTVSPAFTQLLMFGMGLLLVIALVVVWLRS